MKLLLTGSTGFVGRNILCHYLNEKTYDAIYLPVRSIEKLQRQLTEDNFEKIPQSVKPIKCSAPEWDFQPLSVDHVIHCAGVIVGSNEAQYMDTNVEGTINLIMRLKQPAKVILLSSLSAAGPADEVGEKDESHQDQPLTWYGKSKLKMEQRVSRQFPDLDVLFLRPPLIFGARDSASLPLFKMVRNFLQFKPGFHAKHYSFISVSDLIDAISVALFKNTDWKGLPHRHYFVSAKDPVSDRTLIREAAKASQKKERILTVPQPLVKMISQVIDTVPTWRSTIPTLSVDRAKEIWPNRWVASPAKFESAFDWQAKESLSLAMKETHDWYVKTGQLP